MHKVMIIEDEEQIRSGLRHIIETVIGGFKVVAEADNGREALELICGALPDILITDIRMPEMNGIEMIRRIRGDFPNIHIIILSGYDDFEYAKQAIKYQVSEYLLKPLNRVELTEVLQKIRNQLNDKLHMHMKHDAAVDEMNEGRHVIRKVKDYVLQNLAEDISLQRVAQQVHLTHHYLSGLFKTVEGRNYSDFVSECRMDKARLLLKETNLRIYEIANLTGYVSAKHFMNVFKQRVGVTPSDYRNQRP